MRSLLRLSLTLLLAVPSAAWADSRQIALGAGATVYRVQAGQLSDLLPNAAGPSRPVLVLTVSAPARPVERWIVPGTEGDEIESTAEVVYEEASDSVYLIWESRTNFIHSQIRLASFAQGYWSLPIDVAGEFFSLKTSPSLAITRDTYLTWNDNGDPVHHRRATYHAVWFEEASAGERVVYTPLVLLDGDFIDWNPQIILSDLVPDSVNESPVAPARDLVRAPVIEPGAAKDSVVIGFAHPMSGRYLQFEARSISGELGALSRGLKEDLLLAQAPNGSQDLATLGERARAQVIELGARLNLHPGLLGYLASSVDSTIQSAPLTTAGSDLATLGERARAQIVELGVRMAAQGLGAASTADLAWLVEFPTSAPWTESVDDRPLHSIRVRLSANRAVPLVAPGAAFVYLSRSGAEALVGSESEAGFVYRESENEGWTEERFLAVGSELTASGAHAILEHRVRNR